jgi:hypothetical protein
MSPGSLPSAAHPTLLPTGPKTAQKRPIDETSQVGPSGSTQVQENASDSATSVERRSRPIFKMRRTGHSGPFPLSARPLPQPALQPPVPNGSVGKHITPSPSISSSALSPRNPDAGSNLESVPAFSNPTENHEKPIQADLAGILTPTNANGSASPAQTKTKPVIGHGRNVVS